MSGLSSFQIMQLDCAKIRAERDALRAKLDALVKAIEKANIMLSSHDALRAAIAEAKR